MHSLPTALYRAEQVREFDRIAIEELGIPGETLMERAGVAAFELMRTNWPDAAKAIVLVGPGNNGGDGFVVARLAKESGLEVVVIQLGDKSRLTSDAALNLERYLAIKGDYRAWDGELGEADLIVDAIFGTGLEREVKGEWADAIAQINQHPAPVLALDIPSGLHSDRGVVLGSAVKADMTISFIGLKQGMFTGAAPEQCGAIHFDDLDVPPEVFAREEATVTRVDWQTVTKPPRRSATAHKGHFGHVLVVGGDLGFGGAAIMAAEAALRSGAGLVSLATRAEHIPALLSRLPEVMVHEATEQNLAGLMQQATVVAVGPGLGQEEWGRNVWEQVSQAARPLVVDADALNLLAMSPQQRTDWVLTPHPGEASRLLGICTAEINEDRYAIVRQLQQRYGGAVVLKGAGSLIKGDEDVVRVCSDGNPGMASGGMGDLLTGIIAGLMAQLNDLERAAMLGVALHAAAADLAAADGEAGMRATDLMPHIRKLMNR